MASPNINMRDPVLYRIRRAHHHRTGDAWCIYPLYDFAHPPSDALEHITHSLCTLEFEAHRPLYDWLVENLQVPSRPRQIEFARLNLTYTVMSKRRLLELVQEGHVGGWDDPRMPTIVGMRRRGYTPEALRNVLRAHRRRQAREPVDMALLEHAVREDLNRRAPRLMGVLDPIRVVIENYPEDQVEEFAIGEQSRGSRRRDARRVPFARELFIEREDFMEDPPKKFFRLAPGREVRLRGAYFITCTGVVKDASRRDHRAALHLRSGDPRRRRAGRPQGEGDAALGRGRDRARRRGARSTIGCSTRAARCRRRRLPERPESRVAEVETAKLEPSRRDRRAGDRFQFERLGYFCVDPDTTDGRLVFNRTVTLKDTWARSRRAGRHERLKRGETNHRDTEDHRRFEAVGPRFAVRPRPASNSPRATQFCVLCVAVVKRLRIRVNPC